MMKVLIWLLLLPGVTAAQVVDSCLQLLKDNRSWNYENEKKLYNAGKKNYAAMPFLVNKSLDLKNDALANEVAEDYIENYLMRRSLQQLLTKESLEFIQLNIRHSKGQAFQFISQHRAQVDSVLNEQGMANDIVRQVIYQEEVAPLLANDGKEPDWAKVKEVIAQKYNAEDADRVVLNAQISWYGQKRNWEAYCSCMTKKVDTFGPFGMFTADVKYNEIAWDLFKHCSDTNILKKAITYSGYAIKLSSYTGGEYFDTYANLLYKIGRKEEAIFWQKKALLRSPELNDIRDNLEKMKRGEITWPLYSADTSKRP